MSEIKRGEIYYVESYYSVGSEQRAGRPAIIVSNNRNNECSSTVEVVYMTTQPKHDMPTHVTVHSTGRESIALCEQVHTVDVQRIGNYCGTCTEQEMQSIDIALLVSLGLDLSAGTAEKVVEVPVEVVKEVVKEVPLPVDESKYTAVKAQLEIVQAMYADLLKRAIGKELNA